MNATTHADVRASYGNGRDRTASPNPVASVPDDDKTLRDASVGSLLKELAHEVPSLLGKEVSLAKTEARHTLAATKKGVAAVATGGAVALGGYIILLLAAVYALSNVLAPWLASLIVGASALVAGLAMIKAGKKKFDAEELKPDRTIDSLQKDRNAIKEMTP